MSNRRWIPYLFVGVTVPISSIIAAIVYAKEYIKTAINNFNPTTSGITIESYQVIIAFGVCAFVSFVIAGLCSDEYKNRKREIK